MKRKTVFITGSSRGIGRSIALEFASKGYAVVINSRKSHDLLSLLKDEIEEKNVPCLALIGDISDFDTAEKMVSEIYSTFGDIDVLINNAGIAYLGLLTDMTYSDWNKVIQTNLYSVFNCCNLIVPHMVFKKEGTIINISSVWGEVGASCEVAYSASKGGVNAFTKALAKELAPSNVRVNAIACGAIDTAMNRMLSDEDLISLADEIPASRLGSPDEVARFVYSIAEIESNYLTGQVIKFDGAWI
ncbi:MAG: hypothetical protein K0R15_2302 [Clostridiales bacterium]|jgi:3-oxoacyl-[acyl-carrier protein] reductase|nr:hypothetical protein [Clostridiales bacterium]